MKVQVTLHAGLVKDGKSREASVHLDSSRCTPRDIVAALELSMDSVGLIFVNDVLYKESNEVFDGDTIALLPHMEGG
jgi:molybdopterin converting factor small subunit